MNKIYKVIWSHVKQCYVVTSELAKTHGRTSTRGRTSRLAVAALTAFILTAGVTSVGLAADKDIVDKDAQPIAYDISTANKVTNSNGAIVMGAGNSVKGSSSYFDASAYSKHFDSVTDMQKALMDGVAKSAGGATLVIGGGNTAENTLKTQIIGVNNKVTGTEGTTADFNLIDGYKNTATHVKHATVIGSGNTVSGEEKDNVEGLILLGDNRNVWKQADHSVVIGSSDDTGHSYVTRPDTVVIGHNAYIEDHGGNTSGGGDIAIGHNSFVENYVNQSGSIAFGENTHVRNSVGSTENAFVLGQYETTQDPAGTPIPTDVAKMNASIAIGENTFARTGSLMVGTHKYTGEIGDTTVDTSDATSMAQANQQINETVLGTNSFSLGAFSTVTGAYSIISGDYEKGKWRNFGSSITGSLNSIESKTATTADAGNASHIIGTANRMQNANGAVVIGSGNEITDSYAAMSMPISNNTSAKDLSEKIRESIKANGGGAAAIVGNGNEVKQSTNVSVLGSKNKLTKTKSAQVLGDNREVTDTEGAVIIGSASGTTPLKTDKKNVTVLGYNANATVDGGVAIGAGSVASVDKGAVGYDLANGDHSKDTTGVWKSKAAAVSVGQIVKNEQGQLDAEKTITRQITGVAAGSEDYDAVNVAQLKAVMNLPVHIYNGGKVAGNVYTGGKQIATDMTISNLQFDFGDGLLAQEVGNEGDKRVLVTLDKDALKDDPGFKGPQGDKGDTGAQGPKGEKGDTGAPGKDGKDGKDGGVGTVVGDEMNITVANTETDPAKPANYKVSLNKEITVDKVTAGNTTISSDGLTITGGPSITKSGIDAGGKKVTHVADGEIAADSKDAVNGSQLYRVQKNVESIEDNVTNLAGDVTNLNGRVSDLDNRVNKVGAGAAALAALHPLDFNPDDKWNFAVGYGNYRNANSVAVGAFYQPNENTMFNVATNFGNGENMINAGVSFKIGKGNSYAGISKAQLVAENQQLKENDALQDQKIQKQDQEIQELKKALEELKSRIK